jgi:hypothetical protein
MKKSYAVQKIKNQERGQVINVFLWICLQFRQHLYYTIRGGESYVHYFYYIFNFKVFVKNSTLKT